MNVSAFALVGHIEPMSGAAIAAFVDEAYRAPAEVGKRAAQMLGRGAQ
jgi:hypothetical protein